MNAADADRDDFHIGIIEQILTTQRHYDPLIKAVGAHMDPLVSAFQEDRRVRMTTRRG